MHYSHVDRFIVGGAVPVHQPVKHTIGADSFLELREVGIINIGGKGTVTVDGFELNTGSSCLSDGKSGWGMAGENQTFEDMDAVAMKDLK